MDAPEVGAGVVTVPVTVREVPDDRLLELGKWISQSNFAQGLEGNIDSSHVSFLHRDFGDGGARGLMNQDGAPQLTHRSGAAWHTDRRSHRGEP